MIKIKAGNERNSRAISKFTNAEIGYFGLKLIVHVLIRGSLEKVVAYMFKGRQLGSNRFKPL